MTKMRVGFACAVAISLVPCICVGQSSKFVLNTAAVDSSERDSFEVDSSGLGLPDLCYNYRVVCDEGDYEGPIRTSISEVSHDERQHRQLHPKHHCTFHMVYDGWQAYCGIEKSYIGKLRATPEECFSDAEKHTKNTTEAKSIPDPLNPKHENEVIVPGHTSQIRERHIEVRLKSKADIPTVMVGDIIFHSALELLVYLVFGI